MDVKEAVRMAKEYVINLFDEEQIIDIGLEEVKFDPDSRMWEITIGFARSWQRGGTMKYPFDEEGNLVRSYKTAHIDDDSRTVESLKDRFLVDSFLVNRK